MSNDDSFLHELLVAATPEGKAAILAEIVLSKLTKTASLIARCCVILHWFDEMIVEGLLENTAHSKSEAKGIYNELQALPFVESLLWGQAFNRLTREGLLQSYTSTQPEMLQMAAKLAAPVYRKRKGESIALAEAFFCYLVAGENFVAMELFREAEQQAKMYDNWEYLDGLQELAIEAQQFSFIVPLPETLTKRSEQQSIQEENLFADNRHLSLTRKPSVLIIDDSPTVREIIQNALQGEGIRVITAKDGLSALASAADENPDIILLDIILPGLDGYEICQIIRKNSHFQQIPIIMLSVKDGLFDKMRGRLAGATEYLTKPFDTLELIGVVKKHLANRLSVNPPTSLDRLSVNPPTSLDLPGRDNSKADPNEQRGNEREPTIESRSKADTSSYDA
jgi:twitching motility two-component system response regulator PilG